MPQAHHVAGLHARLDQAVGHAVGGGVQLGIGDVARAEDQRRLVGDARRGGLEDVGQDFAAQQVGPVGAVQDGSVGHRKGSVGAQRGIIETAIPSGIRPQGDDQSHGHSYHADQGIDEVKHTLVDPQETNSSRHGRPG